MALELFKGMNLLEFMDRFKDDESCREYLAHHKWSNGFTCRKCGCIEALNTTRKNIKQCKSCLDLESSTAGTMFHKVKFSLRKAFVMVYTMSTTSKGSSGHNFAKTLSINKNTAWLFQQKIRAAMESSQLYPLKGKVVVDEAFIGGKEEGHQGRGSGTKQEIVIAIEATKNEDGIKRAYAMVIENTSSVELKTIFDGHISKESEVKTDKWSGYSPLKKDWDIQQEKSKGGENFELMNRFVMGLKGWCRGIYHRVTGNYLQGYLNEYCYRFNRSIFKETAFDKLIQRMVLAKPIEYKLLKVKYLT